MMLLWLKLFALSAILINKNLCVPAIRPLSQRGILFPVENWDECFLDEASRRPGLCKTLEQCPEVLKKWDKENIYPKSCYFIKKQQFVCCPLAASIEKPQAFNTNITASTEKSGNIFLNIFNTEPGIFTTTKRPSNIFLDNIKNTTIKTTIRTTTTMKRPSNIFLDGLSTQKTTSQKPTFTIPAIFNTEKPAYVKRRREIECDLQNQQKLDEINGAPLPSNEYPFMAVLGWPSKSDKKIWYPCGGVLISSRFVLTSAHCAEIGDETPKLIRLGDKNLTDLEPNTIKIRRFIAHPGYIGNLATIFNDIALVELEQEVNSPVACLWTQYDLPLTKLTALGYGRAGIDRFDLHQLFPASLRAIDKLQCQEYFKQDEKLKEIEILDGHLCAGDVDNAHKSCQGDTGGPLIMQLNNTAYVVGISSFGLGCADLPPSIYTRVSAFIDWIEQIVWPEIDVRFDKK